jgi:penicillin-binding protein 1A
MGKFLKYLIYLTLITLLLVALFIGAVYIGLFGKLPSKSDLTGIQHEEASLIYSADGEIIGKIFAQNRTNVDSAEVPKYLLDALVATEDRRFYEHEGVDYASYVRVLIRSIILRDKSGGGGSTITQQLIKNLYGRADFGILTMPVVKTKEAIIAKRMEEVYTKNQILVLYFNTVPFGENVWGVEAAALRYFNRHVSEISLPQAALLVGMLKANTAFNPRLYPEAAINRRNTVLNLMERESLISPEENSKAKAAGLDLDYTNYALYNPAGHFAHQVEIEAIRMLDDYNTRNGTNYDLKKDGLQIKTTLQYKMQLMAEAAVKKQLQKKQSILDKELRNSATYKAFKLNHAELAKDTSTAYRSVFLWNDEAPKRITKLDSAWLFESLLHAAVLVADPVSGAVLVWVGGNNYRYLPYDLVLAKRQAASAFKPVVYAAALEAGYSPCDYFSNEVKTYDDFNDWTPQNYDGKSGDEVAMWYALSKSMNLPTVDLFFQTGYDNIRLTAGDLRLDLPTEEQPAIALGAASFSLYQMTRTYSAFANGGVMHEPYIISSISDKQGNVIYRHRSSPERVLTENTTAQLTRMLRNAVTNGTGRSMQSRYGVNAAIAGKTGTAQNYSDAWFMSYTPNLVVGTWVGAMSPQVHFRSGSNGSGSALALPIAARFYKQLEINANYKRNYLVGLDTLQPFSDSADCIAVRDPRLINRVIDKVVPNRDQRAAEREARREQRKKERDERQQKKEEDGWLKKTWKKVFKKK